MFKKANALKLTKPLRIDDQNSNLIEYDTVESIWDEIGAALRTRILSKQRGEKLRQKPRNDV